jgi:hypothetical protein
MAERRTPGSGPDYSQGDPSHAQSGERQRWSEAPHADLVRAFRGLLWQKRQFYGEVAPNFPPAAIIRQELETKTAHSHTLPYAEDVQKREFFSTLVAAWDVIAYEHYPPERHRRLRPGELEVNQMKARGNLSVTHFNAKDRGEAHPELIRLDPMQVRILDALAEAADIPHQRGQTAIPIPEPFRKNYADIAMEEHKQDKERRRAEAKRRGWG